MYIFYTFALQAKQAFLPNAFFLLRESTRSGKEALSDCRKSYLRTWGNFLTAENDACNRGEIFRRLERMPRNQGITLTTKQENTLIYKNKLNVKNE